MKKLYKLLLAAVLTIAVALPVMASPSPEADTIEPSTTVSTTVKDVAVETPSQALSDEVAKVTSDAQGLKDLNVSTSCGGCRSKLQRYYPGRRSADSV